MYQIILFGSLKSIIEIKADAWKVIQDEKMHYDAIRRTSTVHQTQSQRDYLKYFEIFVLWHIRFVEQRKIKNKSNNQISQMKYVSWLRKLEMKTLWNREELLFLLISTIFCYPLLDFYVKTGTRFSPRDKQLFGITEVEITIVEFISQ